MSWTKPFIYIDGLDRDNPNPSREPGSSNAWAAMRRRFEGERVVNGFKEHVRHAQEREASTQLGDLIRAGRIV